MASSDRPEAEPNPSRRSVTMLLGGLGLGALSGCADNPPPGAAETGAALSGGGLWTDSIDGLRTAGPGAAGGAIIMVAGYYTAGDGGGGAFFWDPVFAAADDGALTIQATGVATGRWRRLRDPGVVNVRWFGAKGDVATKGAGATNDHDAIQRAINTTLAEISPASRRAAVDFPAGIYRIDGQLLCDNTIGLQLLGVGDMAGPNADRTTWPASTLLFTANGGSIPRNGYDLPALIDARSVSRFEMEGLGILSDNPDFTGVFLDLSHKGGADSALVHLRHCTFASVAPAVLPGGNQGFAVNAKAHLFAVNAITSTIEKCSFCRAKSGIRGREQVGASVGYSNAITVRDCMFIQTPIAICNPGQNWMIESNTFEGLAQSAADYLHTAVGDDLTAAGTGLLTIRNNWCGDAFGDQVWIKLLAPFYTIIEGNLFSGGVRGIQFVAPAPGHGVGGGVSIRNNEFNSGTPSAAGSAIDLGVGITWKGLEISGNYLASGTAPIANLPVRFAISIFSNIFDYGHLPLPDTSFNGHPGPGYLRITSTTTTGPLTYQVTHMDTFMELNAQQADITAVLPDITSCPIGREYTFKRFDGSTHAITISGITGQGIDGAPSLTLTSQNAGVTLVAADPAVNWRVKSRT